MVEITKDGIEATFLNTLAFLSFQISQAVRKINVVIPLRCWPWTPEIEHIQ
jgi:hypothetical protein